VLFLNYRRNTPANCSLTPFWNRLDEKSYDKSKMKNKETFMQQSVRFFLQNVRDSGFDLDGSPDFKEKHDCPDTGTFFDIEVKRDVDGRWYIQASDPGRYLKNEVLDSVTEVTLHTQLQRVPERISGIYKFNTAEAELDVKEGEPANGKILKIRGKNREDVCELYRLIRAGQIMPTHNWEANQYGALAKGLLSKAFSVFKKEVC